METIAVNVRRVQAGGIEADLERAAQIARLLDSQFEIGGVKFGLDSIIGLVPVIGDTLTAAIGAYPIYLARKHKLGRRVQARMLLNLALDYVGGLVPVVGDLVDVAFKANLRNFALLQEAAKRRPRVRIEG